MNHYDHYCERTEEFPLNKFFQLGKGKGQEILIVGESPAPNGWRKSGKAFYTIDGKLLPTGKNLNLLLNTYDLNIENCNFTELVKCYVGSERKLLDTCGIKCWPIFTQQLCMQNIKTIILLGVKTLELFNKCSHSSILIGRISKILINQKEYKVLPLFHPSPVSPIGHKSNLKIFEDNAMELRKLFN